MMESNKLKGQATQEQIDNWKKKVKDDYGADHKVFKYEVDGRVAYLRSATRDDWSFASSKMSSSAPGKFSETILERIWLGGDDAIRREDGYYFGLNEFVEELMNKKLGQLGEL